MEQTKDEKDSARLRELGRQLEPVPKHLSEALCGRCAHSQIFQRANNKLTTYCDNISKIVPDDIIECSAYAEPHHMNIYDMEKIGLLIDDRPLPGGYA